VNIRTECIHFRGHIPCRPHKLHGHHCDGCPEFRRRQGRILLIKLGAAGDVIRTTPLLEPLRREYPDHVLTWVTDFPELVPSAVDDVVALHSADRLWVEQTPWDLVINLDKDREACALARKVTSKKLLGFTLGDDGLCRPVTEGVSEACSRAARDKFATGVFDDVNQACTLSYPQEIFAICGYEFTGQNYVVDRPDPAPEFDLPAGQPVVGLNTGAGGRWPSRLWPEKHWRALAVDLQSAGLTVLLLGGPQEDEKNRRLAADTGALYLGHFDLRSFIGLMDRCDLVVTAVTMAMHIALGLGKKLVLFNNIFNPHEFELYGQGVIMAPEQECTCFFQPRCTNQNFCLETLTPAAVSTEVKRLLELS
jgi:ADP-heptose:LPS heptosyltransferase